ncbi:MAG: hypothetical protein V2J55_20155 [Candidatus Competibacteraceae bacterium]|jgi:hypothetical protein|nr:hypothetical protein [Candidatus Competibacteraceae bacterium]
MILKPQDVVILLKLAAIGKAPWSYSRLAVSLWMSPSEVHAGVKRTIAARLASMRKDRAVPNARNLEEFIVHGLPYVFVPELGEVTRGMPTGFAGQPLSSLFEASDNLVPVWPDPNGGERTGFFAVIQVGSTSRSGGRPSLCSVDVGRCDPGRASTRKKCGHRGNTEKVESVCRGAEIPTSNYLRRQSGN